MALKENNTWTMDPIQTIIMSEEDQEWSRRSKLFESDESIMDRIKEIAWSWDKKQAIFPGFQN